MLSVQNKIKGVYSPLYHLISKLIEENFDCFNGENPEKIENEIRSAYLIPIHFPIENHLFETQAGFQDFLFEERHFSFDKLYKASESVQHGLTAIHYTETYYSRQKNQYIIVHAYLNRDGRYLYLQARRLGSDKKTLIENLNIDSALERSVQLNMNQEACREKLDFLLEERRARYSELKENADYLDNELGDLFNKIVKNGIDEYIKKANAFIDVIADLNAYSEEKDYRGEFFLNQLQEIKEWEKRLRASSVVIDADFCGSKVPVMTVEKSVVSTKPESSVIESQEESFETIIKQLKKLENSLKKEKAKTVLELSEKMSTFEKANQLLLALLSLPKEIFNKKTCSSERDRAFLVFTGAREKSYEEWLCFLKKFVLEGELKKVIETCVLFPAFKSKLSKDFYEFLIMTVVNCMGVELEKKLVSVCDYFNENSEEYRNCILSFSQEQKFLILEKDIKKMSKYFHFDVNVSLLYKLYFNERKDLFSMFLQHGADPNTWGVKGVNQKEAPFSLLYVIGAFEEEKRNCLEYLELLLKYNANASQIYTTQKLRSMRHGMLKARQEVTKTNKTLASNSRRHGNNNNLRLDVVSTEIRSTLLSLMAWRENSRGLELLLPSSSLEDIAYTFSFSINSKEINSRQIPSNIGGDIVFAENADDLTKKSNFFIQKVFELPFFIFGFYPINEKNSFTMSIFKRAKTLYTVFEKKTLLLNKEEFEDVYNKLFNRGSEMLSQKEWKQAGWNFYACQYLLAIRCQKLTRKEKIKLMKDKIPVLNPWLMKLIKELYKESPLFDYYVGIYTAQMNACKNTKAHAEWVNGTVISILADARSSTRFDATSIQNLSYSLGALSANNAFWVGSVMVEEPQVFFFKTKEDMNSVVQEIQKDNKNRKYRTPFFTFFLFPYEENIDNIGTSPDVYVDNVNAIYNTLSKRVRALDNNNFDKQYRLLFDFGCMALSRRLVDQAQSALQGCEYLLIERCKVLDKEEQSKLMKEYGLELNEKIILIYRRKYSSAEDLKLLETMLFRCLDRDEGFKIEFNYEERDAINNAIVCLQEAKQFLTSIADLNKKPKQIVAYGKDRLESILYKLHYHRKDGDYSQEQFSNLKALTQNLSRCMAFGYEHARAMADNDAPNRTDYVLSGKAIQLQQWERWKKEYHKQYPQKVVNGYGPGALVLKK